MKVGPVNPDEMFGYFAWAVEQSNSTRPVALYLTSPDTNDRVAVTLLRRAIVTNLYATPSPYSYEQPPDYPATNERASKPLTEQYTEAIGGVAVGLFGNQRMQFGADAEQSVPAYAEDVAYHLMLTCFLGVLDGNSDAFRWLTALMVRGGPNRQLTISRFLGLATDELIRPFRETYLIVTSFLDGSHPTVALFFNGWLQRPPTLRWKVCCPAWL